jgi:hypothetical protein
METSRLTQDVVCYQQMGEESRERDECRNPCCSTTSGFGCGYLGVSVAVSRATEVVNPDKGEMADFPGIISVATRRWL